MPSPPLRIAILECDTPLENVRAKYGTYGDRFTSLFNTAADTLSTTQTPTGCLPHPSSFSKSDLQISAYNVQSNPEEYPDPKDIDAIVMSGSKFTAFHDDPWILKLVAFVKGILEEQQRVRVIGICFGHQIVGRALGGVVKSSEDGWEVSVLGVDLSKRGQEIFGRPGLAIHQMHRDIVATLPPNSDVEILGSSSKCAIQGMYVPKKLITVQGHPEFNEEIMREICNVRHKGGIFNDEVFSEAIDRADKYHDGVLITQAFLRFLLED